MTTAAAKRRAPLQVQSLRIGEVRICVHHRNEAAGGDTHARPLVCATTAMHIADANRGPGVSPSFSGAGAYADVTSMGISSSLIRSATPSRQTVGGSLMASRSRTMPAHVSSVDAHGGVMPAAHARGGGAGWHAVSATSASGSDPTHAVAAAASTANARAPSPPSPPKPPDGAVRVEANPATVGPEQFSEALHPRVLETLRSAAAAPGTSKSMQDAERVVARVAEDDPVLAQALRELAGIYRQQFDAAPAARDSVAAAGFAVAGAYGYPGYAYPSYAYPYGARSYLPYYGGCGYAYGAGTCYAAPYMAGWAQRYMPLYASWPPAVLAPATSTWWWWA